ncbi:PREDICTED: proto-oncogene Mas-like [Nanorana parkeri]|uniref:proto-oncogene Mas-like n=1 Tax=Nanorana parkeri TaxID=125878 RepID=UPI000854FFAF|nr:PREDICTED: proto-oncogene Mas-like [Nanorana parkeri]
MIVMRLDTSNQNDTLIRDSRTAEKDEMTIVSSVFLGVSVVGLVGNLIVFWYLCFKIQRNKYTVYIMNLSAADTLLETVAVVTLMVNINTFNGSNPNFNGIQSFFLSLTILYYAMIYTGMYLLTAISMERCVSTLFPIWNTVHRPQNLSTMLCCFAWALGSLESLLDNLVCGPQTPSVYTLKCSAIGVMDFVLAVGICLPLMVISSLILLIKIKRTFRQRYPPKLYIIIIVAAIMFTLSVLPLNTVRFLLYCKLLPTNLLPVKIVTPSEYWMIVNSAINPYMYFLVGRKWNQGTCFSIQDTLLRAFTVDTANPQH